MKDTTAVHLHLHLHHGLTENTGMLRTVHEHAEMSTAFSSHSDKGKVCA
jgi:hypothetical protein